RDLHNLHSFPTRRSSDLQKWYPQLEALDRNLGMSAFHAGNYQDAILPLWHALQRAPNDQRVRAALGLSYFSVQNYQAVAEALQPDRKSTRLNSSHLVTSY